MAESTKFQNFAGAEIWKHFLRSVCGKQAQCLIYYKYITLIQYLK